MSAAPLFDWPDRSRPRPVLALDLARKFGWCAGVPGAHPEYGTVELQGRAHGVVYSDLIRWIHALIRQHHPAEIAIEAPLGSGGSSTTRLACGLAAHLQLIAHQEGIPVREEPVWRTRREVLGRSDFPAGTAKSEAVAWCRANGFAPGDDNAAEVIRVVELDGEHRPVRFATFCPVALAGIGKLPDTLADRCVPITLQRKAAAETVVKLRALGARDSLHIAARCLARWAQDHGATLPLTPEIPDAMGDREGDISVPLLAIADSAGGEWPARARAALLEVFGIRNAAEGTMEAGALLLADLRQLFLGSSATRLTSAGICEHLGQMEERPWPEWKHGKPMTPTQLARALAPFGVRPANLRQPDGKVPKGYHRDAFEEAWNRYLPSDTSSSPNPPHSSRYTATSEERPGFAANSEPLHDTPCSGSENGFKPAEDLGCSGVADQYPPFGGNEGSEAFEATL
nr:DUF3631 domain-containing protein [Neoroseomonas terrae]